MAVPRVRVVDVFVGRLWQAVLFLAGLVSRDARAAKRTILTHPIKRCVAEQSGSAAASKMCFAIPVQINAGRLWFCGGAVPGIRISFVCVGGSGQTILVFAGLVDRDAPGFCRVLVALPSKRRKFDQTGVYTIVTLAIFIQVGGLFDDLHRGCLYDC